MMTVPELHPDVLAAKYDALKVWRQCTLGRHETLTGWQTTTTADGALWLSAQAQGPEPGPVLKKVAECQFAHITNRAMPGSGHQIPALDVSQEGRTAYVWRTGGVWVEIWHANPPATPEPTPIRPSRPSPATALRGLGARLPYTRRPGEAKPA
jgi:hypothetical protein